MKIWTIVNQKGGVGKTTTAVSLAGLCTLHGSRTLLVDLDPHGSLTAYFGYDPESAERSVYTLFQNERTPKPVVQSLIRPTTIDNLDVLPASTALATLDKQLGAKSGMGLALTNALQLLADRYDHVFIDCPPMLGVLMVNALAACQHLVIPVQTEFLAVKGLERMLSTIRMIEKAKSLHIPYTVVPTMYDRRTRASMDTHDLLRERFADHLWHSVIPVDTRFREASKAGLPISHFKPSTRGAGAYAELFDDLLQGRSIRKQVAAS